MAGYDKKDTSVVDDGKGLKDLYLNDNKLHSSIPTQLGNMGSMEVRGRSD